MSKSTVAIITLTLLFAVHATPQQGAQDKTPLTHDVYDGWKNLARQQISPDGRWVSWEVNPQHGDGWLFVKDLATGDLDSIARGHRAEFSPNSTFMAFYVSVPVAVTRQGKVDKLTDEQMPRDSIGIYLFDRRSNTIAGQAGSFGVAKEESDWMVYLLRRRPLTGEQNAGAAPGSQPGSESRTTLNIFNPVTRETHQFENVNEYSLSLNGRLVAFIQSDPAPADSSGKENSVGQEAEATSGQRQAAATGQGGSAGDGSSTTKGRTTVSVFNTETSETTLLLDAPGKAISITTSPQGTQAAFLFAPANRPGAGPAAEDHTDTSPREYDLWHWEEGTDPLSPAVGATTPGMPEGWGVSEHGNLSFSENGERLFFGTAVKPQPEPTDTLLDEEKYRVDIWHYKDPMIQPQQLVQLRNEQRRSYQAVYHTPLQQMVQLATPAIPEVTPMQKGTNSYEMGTSTLPYLIQNSFESGNYADIYLIDVHTGNHLKVLEKYRGSSHASTLGNARLSPEGKYLIWFSQADSNWHALATDDVASMAAAPAGSTLPRTTGSTPGNNHPTATNRNPFGTIINTGKTLVASGTPMGSIIAHRGTTTSITSGIPLPLYNELYDQPSAPGPYGLGTFTEGDSHVLVYDRFDIWKVDPSGAEPPENLTGGYGRENNISFRYINPGKEDEMPGNRDRIMLSAFNIYSKQSGFYEVRINRPASLSQITLDDVRYFTPQKAREADVLIWRRSTFSEYPDLYTSNMNFRSPQKISNANPQQKRYRWGEAELVDWVSFSRDTLQGILYKPENMEPGKKYPMIVYFYERLSDNLHNHYVPSPSRSTINMSFSVSNGYLVFVPDIPYTLGYPGQSAYDAIVSGTNAMLNQFDFVDRNNIGIQGQSWAGYQIAWLITRTNLFRAAMAGAPVSNMTSAYGGIRWATGLSRIYQYEETQSRIGGTLWEKPLRYLENSPLFMADRVSTPLLMMHNDDDGAVPWYQGIEFFMALRRLGQPVWMLNYNDEAHNLTRRPNMKDLSVRMYQFFDHYLKGEPAPAWMVDGIPATKKGITGAYELVE